MQRKIDEVKKIDQDIYILSALQISKSHPL